MLFTRPLAIVLIVAALLVLPTAAHARPQVIPPRWSAPSAPPHSTPKPRPPAPPVDGALLGSGGLILVALLGFAGRVVTLRLA